MSRVDSSQYPVLCVRKNSGMNCIRPAKSNSELFDLTPHLKKKIAKAYEKIMSDRNLNVGLLINLSQSK